MIIRRRRRRKKRKKIRLFLDKNFFYCSIEKFPFLNVTKKKRRRRKEEFLQILNDVELMINFEYHSTLFLNKNKFNLKKEIENKKEKKRERYSFYDTCQSYRKLSF